MNSERVAAILRGVVLLMVVAAGSGCQSWIGRGMRRVFVGRPRPVESAQTYANVTPRISVTDGRAAGGSATAVRAAPAEASSDAVALPVQEKPDYRVAVVTHPNDPMARFNLGQEYLEQGRLEEATFEFDMASSLDPTFAESYFMLGRTLRLRRQFDLATAKLTAAIRLDPRLSAAYVECGICWDQRGYYAKAREQYLAALELSPSDPEIFNNLGYSNFLEGELSAAIKHYKRAIGIDPSHVRAHNNLALAYAGKRDYKKCFEHFRRAHGEAVANNNVGYLLSQEQKFDEAIAYYRRSLQLSPDSQRALLNLEQALRSTGRIDEAEIVHRRFLQAQKFTVESPSRSVSPSATAGPKSGAGQ